MVKMPSAEVSHLENEICFENNPSCREWGGRWELLFGRPSTLSWKNTYPLKLFAWFFRSIPALLWINRGCGNTGRFGWVASSTKFASSGWSNFSKGCSSWSLATPITRSAWAFPMCSSLFFWSWNVFYTFDTDISQSACSYIIFIRASKRLFCFRGSTFRS